VPASTSALPYFPDCEINMNVPTQPTPAPSTKKLPCRGCTVKCSYYATCDGKPWRKQAL